MGILGMYHVIRGLCMDTDKIMDIIYDALNNSPSLPAVTIVVDGGKLFLQLDDGTKYKITIRKTLKNF